MGRPISIKLLKIINVVKYYHTTINISTCFVLWWTQMNQSYLHFFPQTCQFFFSEHFIFFLKNIISNIEQCLISGFQVKIFANFLKNLFEREIEFGFKKRFPIDRKMRCVSFSRCRNGYENQFHKSDYFLFL